MRRPPFTHFRGVITPSLRCLGLIALVLVTANSTQAAVLVYDGFGVPPYTDGADIDGNGNGTGWAAPWDSSSTTTTDDYLTVAGSIAPNSVPGQDGMMVRATSSGTPIVGREYSTTFGGATPDAAVSNVWFSLAFVRNNARNFAINPFATQNSNAGQFIGLSSVNGSNDISIRMRYGTSAQIEFSENAFTANQATSYFVVGNMRFNEEGTEDVLDVWFVESDSFTGTLAETPTLSVSYDYSSSFNYWVVDAGNPNGTENSVYYDEFRIGNSAQDVGVIPEPSAATALLGAAGFLALLRRRSQSAR